MDDVINKTQFATKRYRAKIKVEKKQIQLNKKMLKKNEIKKKQKNNQIENNWRRYKTTWTYSKKRLRNKKEQN